MTDTFSVKHTRLCRAVGFDDEDLSRPLIGIANAFSDIVPGHANLRQLADHAKKGIYQAGGSAVEFGVIGCCDGVASGHKGNLYALPSREIIADSIETMVHAHKLDGLLLLGSCDKIVPGMLMGAARANVPSLLLPGGPMLGGPSFGNKKKADGTTVDEAIGMLQVGECDPETVRRLETVCYPTCGSCSFYGTANTMCCVAEAMGMALPDAGSAPAVYAERLRLASRSGRQIVALVNKNLRPRDILTFDALKNGIAFLMASGGSTNAVLHLCALAWELGIDPADILQEFDRQSAVVPYIARINPASGDYDMEDFYRAGGVMRVLDYLRDHLSLSVLTGTGETLADTRSAHRYLYTDDPSAVIRRPDQPFHTLGGLAVMRGNLAPDTGIAKPAAIAKQCRVFTGEAICFDSEEECSEALAQQKIRPGHVVVIRYEGPKGGPGMREMYEPMKRMVGQGLALTAALITDGRFSGTNNGCFVGHICPEAAAGGPIALVRDGDRITIDVNKKELTLHVDDAVLEERRKAWTYTPKPASGVLARYAKLASGADRGGVLEC